MYLDIEKAPYFSDSSTKQVVVTEGDNVSLDCKPAGTPEPEAFWERVQEGPVYYGGSVLQWVGEGVRGLVHTVNLT